VAIRFWQGLDFYGRHQLAPIRAAGTGDPDFRPCYRCLVPCQVHKTAISIFWRPFRTILPSVSAFDDLSSLSYYLDLPFDVRRVSHTQPMWPRLSRHPQSRPGRGHSEMSKATEVSSLLHKRFFLMWITYLLWLLVCLGHMFLKKYKWSFDPASQQEIKE